LESMAVLFLFLAFGVWKGFPRFSSGLECLFGEETRQAGSILMTNDES
jgi:hypothetical protein